MSNVCIVDDEFVREIPRWTADLSDGTTVYMDDGRPGVQPESAWLRLREHINTNSLRINAIWLQFRSHRFQVGWPDAEGYYFAKWIQQTWGDAHATHGFVFGEIRDGKLTTRTWKTPELVLVEGPTERNRENLGDYETLQVG